MYKPRGTEPSGGGQLYIDFLTSLIPVNDWQRFFSGVVGARQSQVSNGPQWEFPIHSIGITGSRSTQFLRIYQRRPASICIPNQNINTRSANRIQAWSPTYGFPAPVNPRVRHALPTGLVVFLVRTYDGHVWAGWYQNTGRARTPCQNQAAADLITQLANANNQEGGAGMITFSRGNLLLDESNAPCPFTTTTATAPPSASLSTQRPSRRGRTSRRTGGTRRDTRHHQQRTEEEIIGNLFGEDVVDSTEQAEQTREVIVRVRRRNQNAVRDLKALYHRQCQISGDRFTFPKIDGTPYTEAHHLVPLGYGGADDPRNIIIVSPLIHRMLHYADVSGIDLSKIVEQPNGSATLDIKISGKNYTITWHAEHANRIRRWEKTPRK